MITAALMTLVEEGLVSLDDSVTKYLPYFSKFTVYRGGTTDATLETTPIGLEMTIRHLLTHTWGFPGQRHMATTDPAVRMLDSLAADLNPTIGVDADFEALTEVPLIAQPGQQYRFSLGISVVAHIITKVTGVPLHEFVSERIFTPLGMAESGWSVPATDQVRSVLSLSVLFALCTRCMCVCVQPRRQMTPQQSAARSADVDYPSS